ncbi:response regulator [Lysobacter auxotrophicus]|uniref:Hybrid sensor histidine kinase/response regulator n=1 Tax=Lysobacter auxotrophicus TaxID=2992573 RepID=A0ABM8DF44_9GAMM|nr:response regulator [Lysobacter auxotrophicus]BDU17221.1 hybrid sensor histidine kinase/response regulator [Lysobacter auxotrophicus]
MPMMPDTVPRILLVEDDPTSRAFLTAALEAMPAEVDSVDSLATALTFASSRSYSAWMIDARLPDGSGEELLARLRERDAHTPAIAHTAAFESTVLDALHDAGFAEALVKPMPAATLQAAVRRVLGFATTEAPASGIVIDERLPLWDDDAAALALNGNRTHVDTLRDLFVQELAKSVYAISTAAERGDLDSVRGDLHRLRASCGFVGAQRLAAAVQALQEDPASTSRLGALEHIAQDTLANARVVPHSSRLPDVQSAAF